MPHTPRCTHLHPPTSQALSWALDRGALCMQPGGFPLPQFLAVYASPITPAVSGRGTSKGAMPRRGSQGRLEEDAGGPLRMVASWLAKNVLVAVAAGLLQLDLPGLAESFVSGAWPQQAADKVLPVRQPFAAAAAASPAALCLARLPLAPTPLAACWR